MFTMENYPPEALVMASMRGWVYSTHQTALDSGNEDMITLTHPINWLTEDEAEEWFT